MRFVIILMFILILNNLKANNDTIYFDKNWKKCAADTHSFYRLVDFKNNLYYVKDYFGKSKKIQMEGTYSSLDVEIQQGKFYYYFENGNIQSEINYINGKKNGEAKYYYETGELLSIKNYLEGNLHGDLLSYFKNGNLKSETNYVNDKKIGGAKYYYETAELSAIKNYLDGKLNGDYIRYYKNGIIKRKEIYENDSVITGKTFNKKGKEIKYFPESEMPLYPGGQKQFQNDLMKSIIIPDKILENGIDKKVIVEFILNKKGKIFKIKFLTQQEKELEKAIIIGLKKTKKWKPAKNEGEKIYSVLTIPVNFIVK